MAFDATSPQLKKVVEKPHNYEDQQFNDLLCNTSKWFNYLLQ